MNQENLFVQHVCLPPVGSEGVSLLEHTFVLQASFFFAYQGKKTVQVFHLYFYHVDINMFIMNSIQNTPYQKCLKDKIFFEH